ncbi:MAG TPA: MarR family transcriptional regulator [Holophagaceae bacterium]
MQQEAFWAQASLPHIVTALKSRMRQVAWRRLAPFGISPQQFQLLMAIAEQDGRCHGDLARCTWMDKPTATRILKTLQDRGLVRAEPDPEHGRRVRYHLLPAAEPLVEQLRGYRRYMREGMERGLSAEERVHLRQIVTVVMGNLDRMEAELIEAEAGSKE